MKAEVLVILPLTSGLYMVVLLRESITAMKMGKRVEKRPKP